MPNSPDSDRDLRKEIAADAAEPEETPSIFVRAGQFFLVPLVIVTACVGVYAFFQYMSAGPGSPRDLIADIRTGGAATRKHAALQLVQVVSAQFHQGRLDPTLFDPLLSLFKDLPANEAPTDPVTQKLVGDGPSMRSLLALCLSYFRDARAVEPILQAMKDERNADTLAAYLDSLGGIGASEAAPELIKMLDHPSTVVKRYAAFNLAAVAGPKPDAMRGESTVAVPRVPEAIPHLHRKLKESGERDEVRWNAALGLALFLKDPAGREVLLQMLDRAHLERVIGAAKNERNGAQLVAHAMSQACIAAGVLKDPSFKPALEKVEKDPDLNVRAAARRAQEEIAKK